MSDKADLRHDRDLRGEGSLVAHFIYWGGALLAAWHIWLNTFGVLSELRASTIHFAGFAVIGALAWPLLAGGGRRGALALLLDGMIGLLAVGCVFYLFLGEESFYARSSTFRWYDWVFTIAAPLIALELIRRTTGWVVPILCVIAFLYMTLLGPWVPGAFRFAGLSLEIALFRVFYSDDGMFGNIAQISWNLVAMFIIFGAFLQVSGADRFVLDIGRALARRMLGGPGFVAVIASALSGTISGSAVANVTSTGVVTIPLMKKAGFKPHFAAGVETAASTGGGILPPIMGAGAFIMASMTSVPYLTIAAVSAIPAIVYFFGVAMGVRIHAKRHDLRFVDEEAPPMWETVRRRGLPFLVPFTLLLYLLFTGIGPAYAAGAAIVAVVVVSWISDTPMGPRRIIEALALGAKSMAPTAVLLVGIGIMISAVATTGIGSTFSIMIDRWAAGNLAIALVLIALASLVLGAALPVTASYVVLATLSAPALTDMILSQTATASLVAGNIPDMVRMIGQLAVPDLVIPPAGTAMAQADAVRLLAAIPIEMRSQIFDSLLTPGAATLALLSAHMIIFWLSQDSNVTPPVCIPAYAAASIAGAKPLPTAMVAWRLSKALYFVPLMMAYQPFLSSNVFVQLYIAAFALPGIYAMSAAIEGFAEAPLKIVERVVMGVAGFVLIVPFGEVANWVAISVFIALMTINLRRSRQIARSEAAAAAPA
ncbi:TRAP transporter fused permease subunit [Phreatobacter sp.]|uniref:TRAP transporter permease n=1 Tax=Phreatobacter sp. TaxID=1966341 RepID=UPI0025D0A789|nr:TRAP transporter fused permease subunit [Phreatobacter sp.]